MCACPFFNTTKCYLFNSRPFTEDSFFFCPKKHSAKQWKALEKVNKKGNTISWGTWFRSLLLNDRLPYLECVEDCDHSEICWKKDRKRLNVCCPLHSWIGRPCSSLKPHGIGWENNKRTKLTIKPSPKTKIWLGRNVEIRFPYLIFFLTNKRSFHCANCVVPVSAINRHFRALWEIVLIIRLPGSPLGIDHVTTIRPNLKCVVQTDPRSTMGFSDWTCNTQRLRLA